jgi:hypothetical protein
MRLSKADGYCGEPTNLASSLLAPPYPHFAALHTKSSTASDALHRSSSAHPPPPTTANP